MKCNVCGHEFTPKKENRYVSTEKAVMFSPTKYYDCFDCPECGCQVVAQQRFENVGQLCEFKCEKDCTESEPCG